jgi:hypothetical protein
MRQDRGVFATNFTPHTYQNIDVSFQSNSQHTWLILVE